MTIRWNKEYDRLCGADLRNSLDVPSVDSGIHDWVHGKSDCLTASEVFVNPLLSARQPEPQGEEWGDLPPGRTRFSKIVDDM